MIYFKPEGVVLAFSNFFKAAAFALALADSSSFAFAAALAPTFPFSDSNTLAASNPSASCRGQEQQRGGGPFGRERQYP